MGGISLNHTSYIHWDFYPHIWDVVHVVNEVNTSVEICIDILNIDCEPPLTWKGIHASSITVSLRVIVLLATLLGGIELCTVEFVLVLATTVSFSTSM